MCWVEGELPACVLREGGGVDEGCCAPGLGVGGWVGVWIGHDVAVVVVFRE